MSAQNKPVIDFGSGISLPLPGLQLHNCFEALVDWQADRPAILFNDKTLTFRQLDQAANTLANALLKRSIKLEEPIGVLVERSGSLPIAFLAILKAGGVYVPLVNDHPPFRLANIVDQTGMRFLIALDGLEPASEVHNALAANNDGRAEIFRPENIPDPVFTRPNIIVGPSNLAAILFTSGSSGQPKGVLLRHDACVNMVVGHIVSQNINSEDRLLLSSGPGFILGFRELCLPLLSGAAYAAATRNEIDNPSQLQLLMSRHKVTVALFTPSYLRLFQGALTDGLRCIMTAGEHPDEDNARHYAQSVDYWNMHGATEVCGTFCMYKVSPDDVGTIPSGRPFPNTAVYLLDEQGNETPQGEIGEIHVVGVGLAEGYLNQPELTAEIFVETKYGRAYRTGDMGRWRADGNLETIGRSDDVIKVSGQSVALSEIERTLLRHAQVKQAAVIKSGNKLLAFVECREGSAEDWRGYLSSILPGYMIPSSINQIDRFTLNSSGKIDRQALLIEAKNFSAANSEPPEGRSEQEIAEVWCDILKLDAIGRHDNFYSIGGTSLLAIAICQQLQALDYAVTVSTLLVHPTVAGLADYLSQISREKLEQAENLATKAQEDFWIAARLGVMPSSMLITRVLHISGDCPSHETWLAAWRNLLARHSALRTAFYQDADENIRWRTYALDELSAEAALKTADCNTLDEAGALIAAWTAIPFDLTRAPLARAGLINTQETHLFWFAFHHSVIDGLSAGILQEELYALLQGKTLAPSADGINLACIAEQAYLKTPKAEIDRDFWQTHLNKAVADTGGNAFNAFATDFERPVDPTRMSAKAMTERLDAQCVEALTQLARSQGVGMHSLLLALLGEVARKRNDRTSVVIGSALAMRPVGAEQATGLFVNLLPLLLFGEKSEKFDQRIQNAQAALNAAIQSIGTPSSQILRDFQNKNPDILPLSRASLFDISLTANTSRISDETDAKFSLAPYVLPGETNPVPNGIDLAFSHEPDLQGGLILTLAWNPELYRQSTAQAWLAAFKEHALWLAAEPSRVQQPMPSLLPFEEQLLQKWEQGPSISVPELCLHQVFESWADKTPFADALIGENETVIYAELDRRANGIAHALLAHGLKTGATVAVLADIGNELPGVILGIWKAGGAYLPLAVDHPPERLIHMMRDAGARILLALDSQPVPAALSDLASVVLTPACWQPSEQRPAIVLSADSTAYVIYTSGTSGMPKGVPIAHDATINIIQESALAIRLTAEDHIASVATPSFDASLWELGLGLLNGAALVPISKSLRDDPWRLKDYYNQMGVTVAFHTPSYLRISKNKPFNGLRVLIVGGEASSHEDVNIHGDGPEFWHAYGPTETTIIVSLEYIPPFPDPSRPLSVGPPLANTRISIRNGDGQPLPPGVIGEIWLGGLGLSKGYLNNDELTAERFVSVDGFRFYRSGDLGCWTKDGCLVIKGRIDHQIKIHGQRIELEEIEKALLALPDVEEALLLVENAANDTKFLRGFVVMAKERELPVEADWHARLAARLPHYMIPATLTAIDSIPVTVNGKVDRETLLQLVGENNIEAIKTVPIGEMETLIAPIWSVLLGREVYREDNFFGLGGNSLLAVSMAHRLSKTLDISIPARYLFTAPTLAAFAARVDETRIQQQNLASPDISDVATEGELEFWVAEQAGLDANPFVMPLTRKVQGDVPQIEQWNQAWAVLTERHTALCTQFDEDEQGVLRRIVTQVDRPEIEETVVSDLASANALIRQRQNRPIPLNTAPLWRAGLVHVEQSGETLFWLAMHHALGDGGSLNILQSELALLLQGKELPPLQSSYAHSAARAAAYIGSDEFNQDSLYWRDSLGALPDTAFEDWPLDMPRLQDGKPGCHRLQICLSASIATELKTIVQRYDSSMHALMLTLLSMEVRRRFNRRRFLLGTPADMRETLDEAGIVGYYVNMLPLIVDGDPADSFESQLTRTQQALAAALYHGRVPFARIYNDFRQQHPGYRHPARYPLFDFVVNEVPLAPPGNADFQFLTDLNLVDGFNYELSEASISQDMVLTHEMMPDGKHMLQLQANLAIYSLETATVWLNSIQQHALWLAAEPSHVQQPMPLLLPFEEQLLQKWEQGLSLPVPELCFHQVFESWVDKTPLTDALISEDGSVSYAELERHANGIAHALLDHGLKTGATVAVLADIGNDLPGAILGIWKAGGVYLPLAIDHPPERLAHMMRDAEARFLLALDSQPVPAALSDLATAVLTPACWQPSEQRPAIVCPADSTAYLIYTSGTTGMPKGVPITHDAMINTIQESARATSLSADDHIAFVATPSFDASLWELGLGLLNGAALVPISKSLRDDPWRMKDYYSQMAVTVAFHAPSYLRISKNKPFKGLRVLIVGGEPSSHEDVNIHGHGLEFWHAYGPTETTIIVSLEHIPPFPDPRLPLSVGSPLANTLISIRNSDGQPVPPGVIGEIWLGGLGLSKGYLNNDELTAERFVTVDGCRFYRSGDLGCWTNGGRLVIKGRIDHQIKIHGQRIELEEIEKALLALPDVEEALLLVENAANDTKFLRGFVVMAEGREVPAEADWNARLAARLPHYMIPATLTAIDSIPVTVNGKVDRDVLLKRVGKEQSETIKTPPIGDMETLIAPIWSDLLGREVYRVDNFFGLGGNSLLAVSMAHRLSKVLNISIPARYIFTAPTLAAFAARVDETRIQQQNLASPDTSDVATEGELEFWVAERAGLNVNTFIMPLTRKVLGDVPALEQWNQAWATLTERHAALRTQFAEDEQGVLRRIVTGVEHPAFEETAVSDMTAAHALIRQRQTRTIPLDAAPLWRAGLVHVEQSGETLFWLAMQHAVGDGISLNILLTELALLVQGKKLPPLTASYAHSAARAAAYIDGGEFKQDSLYWRDSLAALPDSAFEDWALDMPRLQDGKPGYHRLQIYMPPQITLALKSIAQRSDSSMHALMLTLFAMEIRRRSKRRQFLLGTPADMRETLDEAGIVGYYVNMLPLIVVGDAADSFEAQLTATQQALATALHHGRVPFARIYNDFREQHPAYRHPTRYPLFDFAVNENPQAQSGKSGFGFQSLARFSETIEYEAVDVSPGQDMVFIHEILPSGELMLQLQVNSALYMVETATAWFNSLRWWVEWLCADQIHARMPLPKLLPQEVELLAQNSYGRIVQRPAKRFHELFESLVDSMGDESSTRIAVMTTEQRFSYLSVEQKANRLANALIQSGVKVGEAVGVLTGRSSLLPSTILGIWKAGAVYLPLSTDLPVERLCHMVGDAAVRQLIILDGLDLTESIARISPTQIRPEQLESFDAGRPSVSGDVGDIAYIIYTSGSTGLPKGTLVSHKSYVNMALGCGEMLGIQSDDRCLMFYSPSFDVSLSDMGVPLLAGATVCPVHEDLIDSPNRFMKFLNDCKITVADVSPTYLRLFDSADFRYLRTLVTGGEAPFPADIVKYSGQIRYFNAYGPTENTVTCALGRLTSDHARTPSCGLPLPNTSMHICDADGNPLPPGEIGELWLGGIGLANGYLGREDLTLAGFVETSEGRRYRSGDIGRWLTKLPAFSAIGYELQFLGRKDSQIKMNGIRIELGEIEHIVGSHPAVFQATVLADEIADKKQRLSAFIHLRNDRACPLDIEWRDYLSAHLPAATIPTSFIVVDSIPVNSSGKVDAASLRRLVREQQQNHVSDNSPQTEMEKHVASVWCELLKLETVQKDDNFFALGGHSLVAIAVAHRLERDLKCPVAARDLFAFPQLSDFSRRIDTEQGLPAAEIAPTDKATAGQMEFWVAEQIGRESRGLNLTLSVTEQDGKVAAAQWRQAWSELVERHHGLRTYFKEDAEGQLLRQIEPSLEIELERECLHDLAAARSFIADRQSMAIPMSSAPLWRAGLVFIEDSRQEVFWLALHHAVGDGVSIGILLDELSLLLAGEKLPAVQGDYNHFAGRELAYLQDQASTVDAAYWAETLDGLGDGDDSKPQPFDEWPLDFSRPVSGGDSKTNGGHFFRIAVDAATAKSLKTFASQHGASLHALMMALLAMETSRRTGRPNFVIGTVGSTRALAEDSAMVNYFLNMLPIPCRINLSDSVEQSMIAMQYGISLALQHDRYAFAQICQDFRSRHPASNHPSRFPLFDLAVTENPGLASAFGRKIRLTSINEGATKEMRYEFKPNPPPQDMLLIHEGLAEDGLGLYWYVNANLYEKDTALAWINALLEWIGFIVSSERQPHTALPPLTPAEETLLDAWQYGPCLARPEGYLQDRFARVAETDPHRAALLVDGETQSYRQIDRQSNGLAEVLRKHGVGPGVAVGVLTERSTTLATTLLAIWKAGGCYLPLSAELPKERLKFMAENAGICLILLQDGLEIPPELAAYQTLNPESVGESDIRIDHNCRDSDPAYIIHTSGSTGEPKGVVITFEGYTNFCLAMKLAMNISADDNILQIASPSFDAWLHELGLAWLNGGALAPVVRSELDDIAGMLAKMEKLRITVASLSPSYLSLFNNAEFPGLRILMTMGEAPLKDNALHYAGRLTYINGYGPSENSIGSCAGPITPQSLRMTAGRPLANTSMYIWKEDRQPVPPGSIGTLWLGGRGLSPGYLNRPELTARSFIETPEGRFYNSGDLARWTQQGEIEILGRLDSQVKVRGQRIELEEIEHQMCRHPGVLQAATVIYRTADDSSGLYGFVCLHSNASPIANSEWRTFLAKKLPSYMIPAVIRVIPAIPVSLSGKVDRKRLIANYLDQDMLQGVSADSATSMLTTSCSRIEKQVVKVWSDIFPGRVLYREDNFFELGGDSLSAIRVINQLRLEFTCAINDLYENPVLADFVKTCQPRGEHFRGLLNKVKLDWQAYAAKLEANPNWRIDGFIAAKEHYRALNEKYSGIDLEPRRAYESVLLTGATGYVGCYLLREMLKKNDRKVTALVRGADSKRCRDRLHEISVHYFGEEIGTELAFHSGLEILPGDLSEPNLGLDREQWLSLAKGIQAIFHCAANVKHYGHYQEFYRDNVVSVQNLLELAAYCSDAPIDFHLISTTSVVGKPPESGFKLFSEYDPPNRELSDNYYIRTKQEAERLVLDARDRLNNASIHRVGNVVFASDDGNLQFNIKANAFFRLIAALMKLGAAPKKVEGLFCYVDLVARAVLLLAETQALANETHHIEHPEETSLAEFIGSAFPIEACDFDRFIDRLLKALDNPEQQQVFYEVLDGFNLYDGQAPQFKAQFIEMTSVRTNALLERLGLSWPDVLAGGQQRFLEEAALYFTVANADSAYEHQDNHVLDNLPQTPMEKYVAEIWAEFLKRETVQKNDNFFALGGHSLSAIAVVHRLGQKLKRPVAARELFAFPLLGDFCRRLDEEQQTPLTEFSPTERATSGQLEFWVAEKAGIETHGLNLRFAVTGQDREITPEQWREAWAETVSRHPALRTYFKEDAGGQLLRQVLPGLKINLERRCLPGLSDVGRYIANKQAKAIPLSSPPLWRAGLVFVEDSRQEVFWLSLHHAVGDGLSIGILLGELSLLLAGEKLPVLQGDYNRFAGCELAYLQDQASAADAAYWAETLDGLGNGDEETSQPFDEWPLDFARPVNRSGATSKGGHLFRIALDAATANSLKAFAAQQGASLHTLMIALLAVETSRRSQRPNFVIGTAASTRASAEDSAMVNYFLNMLPIPCRINRQDSVEQSVAAMQHSISQALQHDRYPFAKICQDFRNRHSTSNHPTRYPLIDLVVTENPGLGLSSAPKNAVRLIPISAGFDSTMRYDFVPSPPPQDMLLIHEPLADGGLGLYWDVDAGLYEQDTALAWINGLLEWINLIVSPNRKAQTPLPLLTPNEEKLLNSWQYGPSLAKPLGHLADYFTLTAAKYPRRPALLLDQEILSYGQIDRQANILAYVLKNHGVGPGVTVAVLTERSITLPTVVLAIWKVGGCYLPLSAELPGERLKFMAEDADSKVLIALDGLNIPPELTFYACLRPETLIHEPTVPINQACQDTDPAYIIYTSGSTGEPKGVVVTFEGFSNFCLGMKLLLELSPGDKILQVASPSFDAWLHELGLAWFYGAALAPIVRHELDDISGMLSKMQRLGITIATLSPSYLGLFDNADFPGLRMLITVGEPPLKTNAQHYAGRLTYINGYGPSENSVATCAGPITSQSLRMTVGQPLPNISVYIWDKDRQPVPPGSIGALWIGGRSLSPGYLNRPELNAERFIETPQGRLYNSGDLARWTQKGEIEILGRIDSQVKLRGQRIELEEIEHQISLHPDVLQTTVVIHGIGDGAPGFYGFVCLRPNAEAVTSGEWRSFLAKKLPNYMIPAAIKAVPSIPVSLSGKVDRKKLIADYLDQDMLTALSNDTAVSNLTAPTGRIEKLIAEAWAEVFPGRTIHVEDNFFELGGHSLAAINVVNRLRQEFTCTINDLYEHPVLADFEKACQPRREHIRGLLAKVKADWQAHSAQLDAKPNERIDGLKAEEERYSARNERYSGIDLGPRHAYQNILLTGATGYVGCYLLREMLSTSGRKVTALVRGVDDAASLDRLHRVLVHYFDQEAGTELAYHPGLQVLAGDLGQPNLGLDRAQWLSLVDRTQAVFHCAANVKHYGHYQEFHRDNVASVQNLLELASYRADAPMDFHLVSTTSVVGKPPESGFNLFTEYDAPNPDSSDNYYIRTKQEAELLLLEARDKLNNAGIYRVGNVVFATDDSGLQINVEDNAFFRIVAALIKLGAVPENVNAAFCHVDLVARAVLLLAETKALANETHHIEHSQETSLAEFISTSFPLVSCDFGLFIDYLLKALDDPDRQQAIYEVLDAFNLYEGKAPQVKAKHIELTCVRTNQLLKRLGLEWSNDSSDGQLRFLREAALRFSTKELPC